MSVRMIGPKGLVWVDGNLREMRRFIGNVNNKTSFTYEYKFEPDQWNGEINVVI